MHHAVFQRQLSFLFESWCRSWSCSLSLVLGLGAPSLGLGLGLVLVQISFGKFTDFIVVEQSRKEEEYRLTGYHIDAQLVGV